MCFNPAHHSIILSVWEQGPQSGINGDIKTIGRKIMLSLADKNYDTTCMSRNTFLTFL